MGIFIRGLKDEIRNRMAPSSPRTLAEAYWNATSVELSLKVSSQISDAMKDLFDKFAKPSSEIKLDDSRDIVKESTIHGSDNTYSNLEREVEKEPANGCDLEHDVPFIPIENKKLEEDEGTDSLVQNPLAAINRLSIVELAAIADFALQEPFPAQPLAIVDARTDAAELDDALKRRVQQQPGYPSLQYLRARMTLRGWQYNEMEQHYVASRIFCHIVYVAHGEEQLRKTVLSEAKYLFKDASNRIFSCEITDKASELPPAAFLIHRTFMIQNQGRESFHKWKE